MIEELLSSSLPLASPSASAALSPSSFKSTGDEGHDDDDYFSCNSSKNDLEDHHDDSPSTTKTPDAVSTFQADAAAGTAAPGATLDTAAGTAALGTAAAAVKAKPDRRLFRICIHHENAPFLVALGVSGFEAGSGLWLPPLLGLDGRFCYALKSDRQFFFWRGAAALHGRLSRAFFRRRFLNQLRLFELPRDSPSTGERLRDRE